MPVGLVAVDTACGTGLANGAYGQRKGSAARRHAVAQMVAVAAGAVVTKDAPDFALVAGVPARRIGWVGPAGHPLERDGDSHWRCPVSGDRFEASGPDDDPTTTIRKVAP